MGACLTLGEARELFKRLAPLFQIRCKPELMPAGVVERGGRRAGFVPFFMNEHQRMFHDSSHRLVVRPKPRQIGSTVYEVRWSLARCMWCEGEVIYVILHDEAAQKYIREDLEKTYDRLPEGMKVRRQKAGDYMWSFPDTGSVLLLDHARVGAGPGRPCTKLVCSEYSRWFRASLGMSASKVGTAQAELLDQLIPMLGESGECVVESTGHTRGDDFHQMCMRLADEEAKGEMGEWRLQFVPASMVFSEEYLHKIWGTYERRGRSLQDFRRDYPETLDDCFRPDDLAFFTEEYLEKVRPYVEAASQRRRLVVLVGDSRGVEAREKARVGVRSGDMRGCMVFEDPVEKDRYVIGVDVGYGIGRSKVRDYSCASVRSRATGVQVAELWGQWPPPEFAEQIALLGWWYNRAGLIIERNGPGLTVITVLRTVLGYNGPFYTETYLDRVTERQTEQIGFTTSGGSGARGKRTVLELYRSEILRGAGGIRSPRLFAELRSFEDIDGRLQASPGAHDDCVIADALAMWWCNMLPAIDLGPTERDFAELGAWARVENYWRWRERQRKMMSHVRIV